MFLDIRLNPSRLRRSDQPLIAYPQKEAPAQIIFQKKPRHDRALDMTGLAIWPLVFVIVGVLMYVVRSSYGKLQTIGLVMFAVGFFFVTAALSSQTLHLGGK